MRGQPGRVLEQASKVGRAGFLHGGQCGQREFVSEMCFDIGHSTPQLVWGKPTHPFSQRETYNAKPSEKVGCKRFSQRLRIESLGHAFSGESRLENQRDML